MTRHEARIRARKRRQRIRRRRALFALLFAGALFAPNMIDAVYKPPPEPLEERAIPLPADSVASRPMLLRRGHPGLSIYELIDLRATAHWRHDRELESVWLVLLLEDSEHAIALREGLAVRDRSAPMGQIFDGRGPELESFDAFEDGDFARDLDRLGQRILRPNDPYLEAAMVTLSPVPEPRAPWLTLLGLLGLALAGRQRSRRKA